jgi:hypothetical protein
MPTLRRLTALLSGLLLLQLTLLGVERPCGEHATRPDRALGTTATAAHGTHDTTPARAPGDSCGVEATASECATMPSCATTLTIPAGAVTVVAGALTSAALPQPVAIHSQPTTGPDVPPPRG